jgi:flagellar biogenesis protein FliO
MARDREESEPMMIEQELNVTRKMGVRWLDRVLSVLRSIRMTRRKRTLRVSETLALGERRNILLIEWESRRYLIGATPGGLTVLDRITGAAAETAGNSESSVDHRAAYAGGSR